MLSLLCFACLAQQYISIDLMGPGRVFEGVGGVSAGASSRLLMDYPAKQRAEILDYLFKPKFGASLQHLKVEIGGDGNSTDGVEPSFARTREEFEHPMRSYFERGYEWWLMEEAKKRNPAMVLDALEWSAPAWIGDKQPGENQWYSRDNQAYMAAFIKGAKRYHGLDVHYIGTWNERYAKAQTLPFVSSFRQFLDGAGLTKVQIVAPDDGNWDFAKDILTNQAARKGVGVIGMHYPQYDGAPTVDAEVQRLAGTDKRLWASEDMAFEAGWKGALQRAARINRNYIFHRITCSLMWSLIAAYYPNLPFPGLGPMVADQPWSGHYSVDPSLWAIAHTTQFAQPGWRYVNANCGVLEGGGSFVTLTNGHDFSVVIETSDAKTPQHFGLKAIGFSGGLKLWKSNASRQFEQVGDVWAPDVLTLDPGAIYTLTTTKGQRKGMTEIPPAQNFPLPYRTHFDGIKVGQSSKYFSDQVGAFEVVRPGVLGQMLRKPVIGWMKDERPQTYFGDANWTNVEVSCLAWLPEKGEVSLFGHIPAQSWFRVMPPAGYGFYVKDNGDWTLNVNRVDEAAPYDTTKTKEVCLASGSVGSFLGRHRLGLRFSGANISAVLDGTVLGTVRDTSYPKGMCGIGSGYNRAEFREVSVVPG